MPTSGTYWNTATWDNLTATTTTATDYFPNVLSNSRYDFSGPKVITSRDLEDFAHRIYRIITEHTRIDITEEEFMEILNEE